MLTFLLLTNHSFSARGSPVVVEPIVPEVPVVPVAEAVVVPKADAIVPVVPKEVVVVPVEVPVVEKKEDVAAVVVPVVEDVAVAGENVQDPQLLLSDPIDKATKMIIDLDEHLRKYLPAEDEIATTLAPAIAYAGDVIDVEPTPAERQNQMTALIDQVNRLAESIEVIYVTVYVPEDFDRDLYDLTEHR